jgi:hypothetical protein
MTSVTVEASIPFTSSRPSYYSVELTSVGVRRCNQAGVDVGDPKLREGAVQRGKEEADEVPEQRAGESAPLSASLHRSAPEARAFSWRVASRYPPRLRRRPSAPETPPNRSRTRSPFSWKAAGSQEGANTLFKRFWGCLAHSDRPRGVSWLGLLIRRAHGHLVSAGGATGE